MFLYIGPGIGLGTIFIVLIVLVLVVVSLAIVLWTPIKKIIRKMKGEKPADTPQKD